MEKGKKVRTHSQVWMETLALLHLQMSRYGDRIHENFRLFSLLLLAVNLFGCILIIHAVEYTEIDWQTYMMQVSLVVDEQEFNYKKIEGPTGPLVYPAGHVYIYALLRWATANGKQIRRAQYIFALLHTLALALVLRIYRRTKRLPFQLIPILFLSRRIVSLFVLRLFNDAVQTIPLFAALLFFSQNRWRTGCVLYSLAVGIKMNALLYAPGLAVILCQALGFLPALGHAFAICLPIQILLALPFLSASSEAYVGRAFEFTRRFLFKWSVNGAFLPESVFVHPNLSIALFVTHLVTLLIFAHFRWTDSATNGILGLIKPSAFVKRPRRKLCPTHALFVLFSSNFIGIVFSRTLHYQFYVWYAHFVPFLIWKGPISAPLKLLCIALIEIIFNIYPPQFLSAFTLNIVHFAVLYSLFSERQATELTIYSETNPKRC